MERLIILTIHRLLGQSATIKEFENVVQVTTPTKTAREALKDFCTVSNIRLLNKEGNEYLIYL